MALLDPVDNFGAPWHLFLISEALIWLKSTRTYTPLLSAGDFSQIMFTLVTGVRPIKVRFLNCFLRLSDKRLLTILIKRKFEEDKS